MIAIESKFTAVMAKKRDAELLEIITTHRSDYQADAISAAEEEIKKRNLSTAQIDQVKQENKIKYEAVEAKANAPLQLHWKILTFIFPAFLNFVIAGTFKADGYHRRFKEAWRWTFYGFGFYFILVMLLALLG